MSRLRRSRHTIAAVCIAGSALVLVLVLALAAAVPSAGAGAEPPVQTHWSPVATSAAGSARLTAPRRVLLVGELDHGPGRRSGGPHPHRASRPPVAGGASLPGGAWTVRRNGAVEGWGDAPPLGDLTARTLAAPIVGMAASPSGRGYWLVASDGGIFAFGDARFAGSLAEVNRLGSQTPVHLTAA